MKFKELWQEFENSMKVDIKTAKELLKKGELSIELYNKDVLKERTATSVGLVGIKSAEEALSELQNFIDRDEVINAKRNIGYKTQQYESVDTFDEGYVQEFEYIAYFYEIQDWDTIKDHQKSDMFKTYVKKKVRTSNVSDYKFRISKVECNILKMYKDDIITLEQLGKAIFGDCEV